MADKAPVFFVILSNSCIHCTNFAPKDSQGNFLKDSEWWKITQDPEITSMYHIKYFIWDRNDPNSSYMPQFMWQEIGLPSLLAASNKEFTKAYDLATDEVLSEDKVDYIKYMGPRKFDMIKKWLIENYPKLI